MTYYYNSSSTYEEDIGDDNLYISAPKIKNFDSSQEAGLKKPNAKEDDSESQDEGLKGTKDEDKA